MRTSETNFVSCPSAHELLSQHLLKPHGPAVLYNLGKVAGDWQELMGYNVSCLRLLLQNAVGIGITFMRYCS